MTNDDRRRMRLAVPAAIDGCALAGFDHAAPVMDLGGETMGTSWRVRFALPAAVDVPALRAAITARLETIVAEMSHWSESSLLSRFNHAPPGSWIDLPEDFATVIAASLLVAERSGGAFDPAIGRLTDLHGLGPRTPPAPPSEAALDDGLCASGWQRLEFDHAARRLRQPGGLWLDLSGVAKGYATDAIAGVLRASGIRHCLVEIGGECVGRGIRPDGDPWWVDLESPPGHDVAPLRVALHQLAVATSGNYVRGDHTLDPRTGRRIVNGVDCVSVLHEQAMMADAWATALTVLGPEQGSLLACRENLAVRLLMRDEGASVEWLSPALRTMLGDF